MDIIRPFYTKAIKREQVRCKCCCHPTYPRIDASIGVGMVGGVKAMVLFLNHLSLELQRL